MASAISRGVLLAVAAAVAFGVTTPIVAWAGREVGPLATAALLYAGAALATAALRAMARSSGPRLVRADAPRLIGVALAGGAVAPALLAWGLQRAGALVGSLLLNLEAVFTVLLARAVFAEPIGRRIGIAVAAMVAGGAALVLDASGGAGIGGAGIGGAGIGGAGTAGALAVAAA
ncbi:MAG TPA: EamA family transporter, partial [Kofleriaceae bacterium]|nr:EamA family transporter [Kofleriaceae bacterium]